MRTKETAAELMEFPPESWQEGYRGECFERGEKNLSSGKRVVYGYSSDPSLYSKLVILGYKTWPVLFKGISWLFAGDVSPKVIEIPEKERKQVETELVRMLGEEDKTREYSRLEFKRLSFFDVPML